MRKEIVLVVTLFFASLVYAGEDIPKRIISLGPSLTEALYFLEEEERLVGVTSYCLRPPEAQEKEKVGSVIKVSLEKILSLEPDLIVTTSLTDPKVIEKLTSLGIKTATFPEPKNFDELCEQFIKLSELVGKKDKAKKIIHDTEERISFITEKVKALEKPNIFIQVGAKPLFTVSKDSFMNDFIRFAGGINIAGEALEGLYSREEVLRKNPDIIIIVTMGIAGKNEKKIWEKYTVLNAVKNNRIYIVDSYKVCSPTPLGFVETLDEITEILHPETKGE